MELGDCTGVARFVPRPADQDEPFDQRGQFRIAVEGAGEHGGGAEKHHRDFLGMESYEIAQELIARVRVMELGAGKVQTTQPAAPVQLHRVGAVVTW